MEGISSPRLGECLRKDVRLQTYGSFHYKPSCAWPPLPGDGITVDLQDGTSRAYDEQIQMYW